MNYFDAYERRLSQNGRSSLSEYKNATSHLIETSFKNDPAYREAFLTNLQEEISTLDIRIVNSDKGNEKKAYLLPNKTVHTGNYISFRDVEGGEMRNYIVTDFEFNISSPCAKIEECKFSISLPHRQSIPIIAEGESYGVKLVSAHEYFSAADAKIKVTLPDSIANRKYLNQNTRFCVNHSRHGIYKVGSIDVYLRGLLVLTCQKDKYLEGLDDLNTGIMFQYDTEDNTPEVEHTLTGSNEIIVDQEQTYTCSADATFSLDAYTIANGLAFITSMTSKTCTIKAGLAHGEFITLTATIGAEKINKNINITRW